MKMIDTATIKAINQGVYFRASRKQERPEIRPWQYIQMEYERVGMMPPANTPVFDSIEDAQIWMCLDRSYNVRLREVAYPVAG